MEDAATGLQTVLTRMAPGTTLTEHEHVELEQSWVLEGRLVDHEGEVEAGNYVWRPAGSRHSASAKKIGKLDVLIHCAGKLIRWEEHKPEVFRNIVDIHLFGNVRLAAAFRPHLKATKGCIINIASMYSYFGAPQVPAYASAKTAIVGLTKSLALAYAEDEIRVNAIAPGWIATEISRGGRENPEFNEKLMNRLPNKRWADPEELAGTAIFLASPASNLINGVTIPVDGGYTAS